MNAKPAITQEKENAMFGKDKPVDRNRERAQSPQTSAAAAPSAKREASEMASCISSSMTVLGKIVGDGVLKIYGRVEGELQAANIMIFEGAQVEGNIAAQDLTVGGHVKGTIHAGRVKLNGTAVVEGDIFHQSLSIEDNARFEGSSRREGADAPSSIEGNGSSPRSLVQPQVVSIDGSRKLMGSPVHDEIFQSAE
jgi:cytoskeletal protein CcmA (bactofilin family)